MDFWYEFTKALVNSYLALFGIDFKVEGMEHIQPGPKIIVANHDHATSGFTLPFVFREKLIFLAQQELFTIPVVGKIIAWADQIPVMVGKGREALKQAQLRLANGHPVVVFPEGKLNKGEGMLRAGSGAAVLALETGAPVLPIGIYTPPRFIRTIQTRMFNRTTVGGWQFGGSIYIKIGEPWLPSANAALETARESFNRNYHTLRQVTEEMMVRVEELAGQAMLMAPPSDQVPLLAPVRHDE
jgi:1-acyl-sn-glycerol-3-phosphate acyltransferase